MMLVLQSVCMFWTVYLILYANELGNRLSRSLFNDFYPRAATPFLMLTLAAMYWMIMGGFMLGESDVVSARGRRDLPKSFLGRIMLTWLNPGPGTGMVFAIVSFIGVTTSVLVLNATVAFDAGTNSSRLTGLAITLIGYMMFYLGLTHLLISLVRSKGNVTPFVSLVACMLIMSLGCIIPYSIELYWNNFRSFSWSANQITNWAWTLSQSGSNGISSDIPFLILMLGLLAVAANIWYVGRDVMVRRISTPQRVLEELAALNPMPPEEELIDPLA